MAPFEILLIEDDPDDRFLFERAVEASGIPATVTWAGTAAEAVTRLNRIGVHAGSSLPRLVVMDLGLPGITGKTLLQVIRNAYGKAEVCIIILTGSMMVDDRIDCELWGISAYLVKPAKLDAMTALVATFPAILGHPLTDRILRLLPALPPQTPPVGKAASIEDPRGPGDTD